jgi:D-beta-D-heptose 7-phosphate kinase / D-beta-D-heptose 1-phosphate adenosyltransferase
MRQNVNALEALLQTNQKPRIAIIGDVLLDHYVHGDVSRISPEAPVPVLKVRSERHTLGGAANVAANAASLGADVHLIGLVGDDPSGAKVAELLAAYPSISANLVVAPDWPTVTKARYVASNHQLVRVDRESDVNINSAAMDGLLLALDEALCEFDVVVLSDYGKGVLSDQVLQTIFSRCAGVTGKQIIVDPKRKRFHAYRGATLITPNRRELSEATDLNCVEDDEALRAAAVAIEQCSANILLTRSERGMSLFATNGADPIHLPAEAQEVFDVSGAGDAVVAAIATTLAAGLSVPLAMHIANAAAAVVVAKFGTAICSVAELECAIRRTSTPRPSEVVRKGDSPLGLLTLDEAVAARQAWATQGLTVGFTNGCFDLVHPGHVSLLEQAAAACDRLIVAINSDASINRLKGPTRPIQNEVARVRVIQAMRGVHAVIVFSQDTPIDAITALEPDALIKGADYTEETVLGASIVKNKGGRIVLARLEDGFSTSNMVRRVTVTSAASERKVVRPAKSSRALTSAKLGDAAW